MFRVQEDEMSKKTQVLGGLISIKQSKSEDDKIIRLLGIQIYRKKKKIKPTKKNLLNIILQKAPQYDDYYIFTSRSGEFWLIMHHLEELLKRNSSTNYLLVFTAKYHVQIFKMLYPQNENYIYLNEVHGELYNLITNEVHFKFANKNFYIPFYLTYFQQVEKEIAENQGHYYASLKGHLNLQSYQKITPFIQEEDRNEIRNYINKTLGSNFVFISPESQSNKHFKPEFWTQLTKALSQKGYQVFCNITQNTNAIENTHSKFFTFAQAYELAKQAKAIIGLRSGFLETIGGFQDKPYFVLYTPFPQRGSAFPPLTSDNVLSGFTLRKLPDVASKNIYEYDTNTLSQDEILSEIINKL